MGCGSLRVNILEALNASFNTLETQVCEMKAEKKSICEELDKYSYQETMVGKDMLELKLGFNSSIEALSNVLKDFHSLPELEKEQNFQKLKVSESIIETYKVLMDRFDTISRLKIEKSAVLNELNKIKKQVLDVQGEKISLEKCFQANHDFLNNQDAYDHEVQAMMMQKEELEDELGGRTSPRMLLRTSNSRLQEVVGNMTEEEAQKELEKMTKRNETLEEFIRFQKDLGHNDIGNTLGTHQRQDKVLKDFNSMVKAKKIKNEQLFDELKEVNSQIEKIQQSILGRMNYDQRMDMLNEIIQKCRASIQKGGKLQLKKLLRKKTLLETVEKTVQKARKVE
jgi:hypothetical protein